MQVHFADEQLAMIDRIDASCNAAGKAPRLRAMAVDQVDIQGFPPDHAGSFETTLLDGVEPGLFETDRLGAAPDEPDRFDPRAPLWGIVGSDPRNPPPVDPDRLAEAVVNWMVKAIFG